MEPQKRKTWMEDHTLKILQWNCRSIKENIDRRCELIGLIYSQQPHIACISETWLTEDIKLPKINGYATTIRKDRTNRGGGGMLMLIRDDVAITYTQIDIPQNCTIEAQVIEIKLSHEKVKLLHMYNPPPNAEINNFEILTSQLGRKYIIVGDLNAHHTNWDPFTQNNTFGNLLSDYITDNNTMTVATTPGLPTYTSRTGNTSTLDLTICSNNILYAIETNSLADHGSDHLPVLTTVNLIPEKLTKTKRPKWKLNDKKWGNWAKDVAKETKIHNTVQEENIAFTQNLTNAAEKHFKKTQDQSKTKFCKPWWTAECSKAVAKRRRARRQMERRPTIPNIIEYKRSVARAKRQIKTAKKETWKKFCSQLTPETPTTQVWNLIKKLNNGKITRNQVLKINGIPINDEESQANIFAEKIEEITNNLPDPITERQKIIIEQAKVEQLNTAYNKRFSIEELRDSIRSLPSDKATGEDDVHNMFLKKLPVNKEKELLGMINRSWRTTKIPKNWKTSLIVPIPKPGKDHTDPNSYRPISLLSCISKVGEKMINTRLQWFLEKFNILSFSQCGFRKRRSTEDLLVKLEHQVRACLINRKVNVTVFFDLERAFDTISHDHLIYKLAAAGIEGNMLAWLEEFLKDRSFKVMVGNSKSEEKHMKLGLPQGSSLSPTLFNLLISDIPHLNDVLIQEYADDLMISATANSLEDAITRIRIAVREIEEWATTNKLNLNPAKTKAMMFTKRRITEVPTLTVKGNDIEWTKTFKYLGLTFDAPTLTWKTHIEDICRQGNQRLNILKSLAGTTWGAERTLLLQVYTSYIRPKLTYGIAAVASAPDSRIDFLNRIQSAALRTALGARKTSPIAALQMEANIPPLDIHIKELCCKFYLKIRSQEETHPLMQSMIQDQTIENKLWSGHFKKTLTKRAQGIMRCWRIPVETQIEDQPQRTFPPWNRPALNIKMELEEPVKKGECIQRLRTIALMTIEENYKDHFHIFTDGSKIENSTTSALWIPELEFKQGWKLEEGELTTIMTAEMFAIRKAMEWILLNYIFIDKQNFVIFTDSMSSLASLQNSSTSKCPIQENHIYRTAALITENDLSITLQWVPSHTGLEHNDRADEEAKIAHNLEVPTPCPLGREEGKRIIKKAAQEAWQLRYETIQEERRLQDKPLEIATIKTSIEHWPWTSHRHRPVETAMARMRISHVELNSYLHRFDQAPSPLCHTCNEEEDVTHYLLRCRRYRQERYQLFKNLLEEGILNINKKILLGGGDLNPNKQKVILDAVGTYLKESRRLHGFTK